jgi:hypothetical protein
MGEWDQDGPKGDWFGGGGGVDSPGSGQGPVAGYSECSNELLGSGAMELVSHEFSVILIQSKLVIFLKVWIKFPKYLFKFSSYWNIRRRIKCVRFDTFVATECYEICLVSQAYQS